MSDDSLEERLHLAARVAPLVRRGAGRTIKIVDDEGNVVREISYREFALELLKRKGVELSVFPDPTVCITCRKKLHRKMLRKAEGREVQCGRCWRNEAPRFCETCKRPLLKEYRRLIRKGLRPPVCLECRREAKRKVKLADAPTICARAGCGAALRPSRSRKPRSPYCSISCGMHSKWRDPDYRKSLSVSHEARRKRCRACGQTGIGRNAKYHATCWAAARRRVNSAGAFEAFGRRESVPEKISR